MYKLLFCALACINVGGTPEDHDTPYNFTPGRREIIGYIPDLHIRTGTPKTYTAVYNYQKLDSKLGFFDVFARSPLQGLSLTPTYGAGPNPTPAPFNTWAYVGGSAGQNHLLICNYSTNAPAVQGRVEIASKNTEFDTPVTYRHLTNVNVYIGSTIEPTWFTVTAQPQNLQDGRLLLDHPYLNKQSGAVVFLTRLVIQPAGRPNNHPCSVHYNTVLGKWEIQNDDGSEISVNMAFHIRIDPSGTTIKAETGKNIFFSSLIIRDDNLDKNPSAVLLITPNNTGVPNPHPVAARYVAPYWTIWNTDGSAMPSGATFNIRVMGYARYISQAHGNKGASYCPGIVVDRDGVARTAGSRRSLDQSWLNNLPDTQVLITANYNPLNQAGAVNTGYAGVSYDPVKRRWGIVNMSGGNMASNAGFNVWAPYTLWDDTRPVITQ